MLDVPTLPENSPALWIVRECLEISSGTLSCLIQSSSYDEIYAVRTNWILFLANNPELAAGCRHWVDAWLLFWDTSHK
jgi:hypothetical protein